MQDWYKEWFGKEYLAVYPHRDTKLAKSEVDFICKSLGLSESDFVLDLACGAGRHLYHLHQSKIKAVGGDLSEALLLDLSEKTPDLSSWVLRYDMRFLPFKENCFDAVLSLFTSFGYFQSDTEHLSVLKAVRSVLKRGGRFFFDFLNANKTIRNLVAHSVKTIGDLKIDEFRNFDQNTKRINKKISIEQNGNTKEFNESVRAYTLNEIEPMLKQASFKINHLFGDYLGNSYSEDSDRLIIIAEGI
ncbi:MAG: class I SAM-dependent methyltransferase [Deltaproteobacteria bacterium]|nr:class I SAM-dependent methyltransferase [Deltaproteobacteria bacterium]